MSFTPRVCVDFDGVIHDYHSWDAGLGEPRQDGVELLRGMQTAREEKLLVVCILTARTDHVAIWQWLKQHGLAGMVDEVTNTKEPALAYIDDRAIDGTLPPAMILMRLAHLAGAQFRSAEQHSGTESAVRLCDLSAMLTSAAMPSPIFDDRM